MVVCGGAGDILRVGLSKSGIGQGRVAATKTQAATRAHEPFIHKDNSPIQSNPIFTVKTQLTEPN